MRSISVTMNVGLDGGVRGLDRPDEDARGSFTHGGWGTWAGFLTSWAHRDDGDPFSTRRNAVKRYVASTTLTRSVATPSGLIVAYYDRLPLSPN